MYCVPNCSESAAKDAGPGPAEGSGLKRRLSGTLLGLCVILLAVSAGCCEKSGEPDASSPIPWPSGLPVYDHVVIVVEENKDYEQIMDQPGAARAPYLNDILRKEGANLTKMFGEEHVSQGNYFWLFSGSNHGVGFRDAIPDEKFVAPNLGTALINKGRSFKAYSEDLPAIGSDAFFGPVGATSRQALYARKHAPWVSFENVPPSSNLRFADFPTGPDGFDALPTVCFVIPNLVNDMHNGKVADSVPLGDQWLKKNLNPYYQWAKGHNSLLIVTWDESDDQAGSDRSTVLGLTNPFVTVTDQRSRNMQNRIATIIAGAGVKPGDYDEGKGVTHVNILRTLEAMYGLPRSGAQQQHAAAGGIRDDFMITDVFETRK